MSTRHHRILTEHPEWVALNDREAKLREAEEAWRARFRKESAEYESAREHWHEDYRAALDRGEEPPQPPNPPSNRSDQARHYLESHAAIGQERRDLLASIAPEVESSAEEREAELIAAARLLVDQLHPLAAELSQLGATLRDVQTATSPGITNRPHIPARVTIGDLVEAIESDQRPLQPEKRKVRIS